MLEYVKMNKAEADALDREKTIFFMAVSPIEVHGDHLPLGTDVFVAEELQRRYETEINSRFSGYTLIKLPALYIGSDALPVKGSLSIPASVMKTLMISIGSGLANQGFRYLFLSDNHGGPRHQMAMEIASRQLWKKHRFYLINPFNVEFRLMVQHDPTFMEKTGLGKGCCGDDADSHAGTNETSLMMVSAPEYIAKNYNETPSSLPPAPSSAIMSAAKITGLFSHQMKKDLEHLSAVMGWVNDKNMKSYLGAPAKASEEAGNAMLQARVEIAMGLFENALRGEKIKTTPMLWGLRILHKIG